MSSLRLATSVLFLLGATSESTAQVQWLPLAPPLTPSARAQLAMVSLHSTGTIVLFGGQTSAQACSNETWSWRDGAWLQHTPVTRPPARAGHAMAADVISERIVLFGGRDTVGYLDDTWVYDASTQQWAAIAVGPHPQGRDWAGFCHDFVNDSMLLFGGHDDRLPVSQLGDTWSFDWTSWTQRFPSLSPAPRFGHTLISGFSLLFGGDVAGVGAANDCWAWNGTTWMAVTTAHSPSPRMFHAMANDGPRSRAVLFGGRLSNGALCNDVWEFDGTDWLPRTTAATPSPREFVGLALAYTPTTYLVAFGGSDQPAGAHQLGETWHYGPVWPASFTSFGTGCLGSLGLPWLSTSLAWLGSNLDFQVSWVPPSDLAWLAFGFSNQVAGGGLVLPLSLAPWGIPCTLYVDPAAVLLQPATPAGPNGYAVWNIALPIAPELLGVVVFSQAGSFDANAPGGFTTSNGCQHVLGSR